MVLIKLRGVQFGLKSTSDPRSADLSIERHEDVAWRDLTNQISENIRSIVKSNILQYLIRMILVIFS